MVMLDKLVHAIAARFNLDQTEVWGLVFDVYGNDKVALFVLRSCYVAPYLTERGQTLFNAYEAAGGELVQRAFYRHLGEVLGFKKYYDRHAHAVHFRGLQLKGREIWERR